MKIKALLIITILAVFIMISYYPITGQESASQTPLSFTDPNLESAIREVLDKPEGNIYPDDFASIKAMSLKNKEITNIADLSYANLTSLQKLDLTSNNIADISPLSGLIVPSLYRLILDRNMISNIDVFSDVELPALRRLSLNYNQIDDITPLVGLYEDISDDLTEDEALVITVSDNDMEIQDDTENRNAVKYLQGNGVWMSWGFGNNTGERPLTFTDYKLESAVRYAIGKSYGDIYPFELSNLKKLEILNQQVIDISVLYDADFYSLEFISFYKNKIREVSGFAEMDFPALNLLYLSYNRIKDFTFLKGMYENGAFRESSGRNFDIYITYNDADFIPEEKLQPIEEPENDANDTMQNNDQEENQNNDQEANGSDELTQEEPRDIGRENLDTLIFLESKGIKIKWRDGNWYRYD